MGCAHLCRGWEYVVETMGQTDDFADADGVDVLNFWQAQDQARQLSAKRTAKSGHRMGRYTVGDAIKDYLEHICEKPSYYDVQKRLDAYVTMEMSRLRSRS